MRTPIADLKPGPVDQTFLLAQVETPMTRMGKPYFRGTLRDVSGSVTAINFEPTPGMLAIKAGQIVTIRGTYSVGVTYGPQIKVSGIAGALESEYDIADFAESCPNDMALVQAVYDTITGSMRNERLARLVDEALSPNGRFSGWGTQTAATTMHHAYRFGLFEHSVQVADIALSAAHTWCPEANPDIIAAAALLHDVGKIVEYDDPMTRQMTTVGRLFGNTALSYVMARDLFKNSNDLVGEIFERDLVYGILHAILAHHGRKEWGSPVEPQTIEALLVHQADQLSSRIGGFQRLARDAQKGAEWTAYDKMFSSALWLGGSRIKDPQEGTT